jgi:hypothetical protein
MDFPERKQPSSLPLKSHLPLKSYAAVEEHAVHAPCSYDFASNSFVKEGGCLSLAVTCLYYSCMYLCSFQQEAAAAASALSSSAAMAAQHVDADEGRKRVLNVALHT